MPPTIHSEFSPSGMAAKLKCLAMHQATKGMDRGSSPAAERGTECHDWAEKLLPAWLADINTLPVPDFVEDWQEGCTEDMVNHVLEEYDKLKIYGDVTVKLEEQVDLGWLSSEEFNMSRIFGTVDVLLHSKEARTLVVLDYKTGIGVDVPPENNVQLVIYALGALELFRGLVDTVYIAISQPRIHRDLRLWKVSVTTLLAWADVVLKPALLIMDGPNAPFTPGKSQCQWCPIAGRCAAQKAEMIAMFDEATTPTATTLCDQEINDLALRLPEFIQWTKQMQGMLQGALEDGVDLPDFKLVRGRGSRGWTDEEAAEKFLIGQKLKEKERHTYKLLSPPQAEKALKENLKRTITKNNFDKLVEKKEGKVTWALKTDKREAVIVDKPGMMIDLNDLI